MYTAAPRAPAHPLFQLLLPPVWLILLLLAGSPAAAQTTAITGRRCQATVSYSGTGETTTTSAGTQIATTVTFGNSGQAGDNSTSPVDPKTLVQTINGNRFWSYNLVHSYLGQLLSQTGSGSLGETETESFGFDQRDRLTSDSEQYTVDSQHSYSNNGSFGWDLSNNLNGQTGGWSYNSDNQLTLANSGLGGLPAATGLSYDAAGNLSTLNGMTLSWDCWGALQQITGAPAGTVSFTYNAEGDRVSKSVGSTTTYYLYDGDDLLCEINAQGQMQTAYTWGPAGLISDRINLQGTPQSRFYQFDALGNTRALLDQNGALLSRGAYTAWGNTLGYSPSTSFSWLGAWGDCTDPETRLVLMSARYYSPAIGRFLSRDPIGFAAGAKV